MQPVVVVDLPDVGAAVGVDLLEAPAGELVAQPLKLLHVSEAVRLRGTVEQLRPQPLRDHGADCFSTRAVLALDCYDWHWPLARGKVSPTNDRSVTDMTTDRDFKDLVGTRMAKTGESYSVARAQLTKPSR